MIPVTNGIYPINVWARKTTNHSYTPLITCMTHGSGTYYITGSWTSVPNTSYVTIQRRLWVKKFHWCPSCHNQVLAGSDWHPFRWCWCWTIPKVVFFCRNSDESHPPTQICANPLLNHGFWLVLIMKGKGFFNPPFLSQIAQIDPRCEPHVMSFHLNHIEPRPVWWSISDP